MKGRQEPPSPEKRSGELSGNLDFVAWIQPPENIGITKENNYLNAHHGKTASFKSHNAAPEAEHPLHPKTTGQFLVPLSRCQDSEPSEKLPPVNFAEIRRISQGETNVLLQEPTVFGRFGCSLYLCPRKPRWMKAVACFPHR